jgi:hypothetical protein
MPLQKNLVKLVIHNSDAGHPTGRKKMFAELSDANSECRDRSIGKGASLFMQDNCNVSSGAVSSTPPVTANHANSNRTKTTHATTAVDEVKRKTAAVMPRTASLSASELKLTSLLDSVTIESCKNGGIVSIPKAMASPKKTSNPIIVSSPQSLSVTSPTSLANASFLGPTTYSNFEEEYPSTPSSCRTNSMDEFVLSPSGSPTLSGTVPVATTPPSNPPRVMETFIINLPNKKQKKELLLIVEKLAAQHKIRMFDDGNTSTTLS